MKRTNLHVLGAVACAAVLSVSVAGCGSSGSGSSGTPKKDTTLSSSDFKSQANAICKTANADIAGIDAKIQAATTDADTLTQYDAFTGRIEKLVTDLKALKVPSELSSDVTSMLDTVSGVVTAAKAQGPTYLSGTTDPFTEADAKATALGLDECAGNTNSASGSPLTADEFKTQANAICAAVSPKVQALNPGDKATDAQYDAAFASVADLLDAEVVDIKALGAPAEIKADVDAMLASVSTGAALVKREGHLVLKATSDPLADASAKATALGLDKCAS